MNNLQEKWNFQRASESWLCNGYFADIRYFASIDNGERKIWNATVLLDYVPAERREALKIEFNNFSAGKLLIEGKSKEALLSMLGELAKGIVSAFDEKYYLPIGGGLYFSSDGNLRERSFYDLHLSIAGETRHRPSQIEVTAIENSLRAFHTPFDGLADLGNFLGLKAPDAHDGMASISISVRPPLDLVTDQCVLSDDKIILKLYSHPELDLANVGLAVCAYPGHALNSRLQIAEKIFWKAESAGIREGNVEIKVEGSDRVLAILMIGGATVRRHWLIDPAKARNARFLAVNNFDKELRMIKKSLLVQQDSKAFEKAVASMLYLQGFNPCIQVETDAPDLIVTTPDGTLLVIECTTKTSDISGKIGKLVDRKNSLVKALESSGHPAHVSAVLVCGLPRDQIAINNESLRDYEIALWSREYLKNCLEDMRSPSDPERIVSAIQAQFKRPFWPI